MKTSSIKMPDTETIKKGTSAVTKWIPFICAGAAVGVSILALKELKKFKLDMIAVKNEQQMHVNKTTTSDPTLSKKMEQLEDQLKRINDFIVNNNPKNPKIIRNALKTEIPKEVKIINEELVQPEENVEYEEVEVTDDEEEES
jgi:predicted RND superfamily exporter protein